MSTLFSDLVTPEVATARVRTLPDESQYALKRFMPEVNIQGIKAMFRTGARNIRPAIARVWDTETPTMARPMSLQQWDYSLPPVGGKIKLGEEEEQMLFLAGSQSPAANAAVVQQLYNDLDTLARSVRLAAEVARGQYLSSGVVTFTLEDGKTLQMDWQIPNGHKVTAGTLWSDLANSTPLTNEVAWINTMVADGIGRPSAALMSSTVLSYLQRNAEYKAALAQTGSTPGVLTIDQVNTVRAAYGLPPIVLYDVVIPATSSYIYPVNKVTLIPPGGTVGQTQFGTTTEARLLASGSNPRIAFNEAPGLVGVVQVEGDPARQVSKVASVFAPVPSTTPNGPNDLFIGTVA